MPGYLNLPRYMLKWCDVSGMGWNGDRDNCSKLVSYAREGVSEGILCKTRNVCE